ncbi:hypothetical protein V1289_002864 [Bradyrhizobium sp. AZCC 2289]
MSSTKARNERLVWIDLGETAHYSYRLWAIKQRSK